MAPLPPQSSKTLPRAGLTGLHGFPLSGGAVAHLHLNADASCVLGCLQKPAARGVVHVLLTKSNGTSASTASPIRTQNSSSHRQHIGHWSSCPSSASCTTTTDSRRSGQVFTHRRLHTGVFANGDEVRFERAGVLSGQKVIAYCGGGIGSTIDAFALTLIGYTDVALYDGSLSEWAGDPSLPMTDPSSSRS